MRLIERIAAWLRRRQESSRRAAEIKQVTYHASLTELRRHREPSWINTRDRDIKSQRRRPL